MKPICMDLNGGTVGEMLLLLVGFFLFVFCFYLPVKKIYTRKRISKTDTKTDVKLMNLSCLALVSFLNSRAFDSFGQR